MENKIDIREVIQCLTDSNALLEDTQQAYGIFPDKHFEGRKAVCDDARAAYGMGGVPYERNTTE